MNIPEMIKEAHNNAIERGVYDCPKCAGGKITCAGAGQCDYDGTECNMDDNCGEFEFHTCTTCKGSCIDPNKNIGELLMLIVSELGEALEAHRSGNFYSNLKAPDYPSPQWASCFEIELSGVFIRLFDLCAYLGIDANGEFFLYGYETIRDITENIANELLEIVEDIISIKKETDDLKSAAIKSMIGFSLARLNCFCQFHNIQIEKHIRAKMAYNRTRPHKHNKEY